MEFKSKGVSMNRRKYKKRAFKMWYWIDKWEDFIYRTSILRLKIERLQARRKKIIFIRINGGISVKLVTFSGPPSSGKTSVILKVIECLKNDGEEIGVIR